MGRHQHHDAARHVQIPVERTAEVSDVDQQLQTGIMQGDPQLGNAPFVGQQVENEDPVRVENILFQPQAAYDGKTGIGAVHHQKGHIAEFGGGILQQAAEKIDHDHPEAHRPHIARKAERLPAEIETEEDNVGNADIGDDVLRDEGDHKQVDIRKRQQGDEGVKPRHAVDAIHEIVDVQDADGGKDGDKGLPAHQIEDAELEKHQKDPRRLHQQPDVGADRMHIIPQADEGDQRHPEDEPRPHQVMHQEKEQAGHIKDHADAADRPS